MKSIIIASFALSFLFALGAANSSINPALQEERSNLIKTLIKLKNDYERQYSLQFLNFFSNFRSQIECNANTCIVIRLYVVYC